MKYFKALTLREQPVMQNFRCNCESSLFPYLLDRSGECLVEAQSDGRRREAEPNIHVNATE